MKSCREQLEETFDGNLEYYRRSVERETLRKLDSRSYRTAEIIDAMLAVNKDGLNGIEASYNSITLTFQDFYSARKFASRVLDRFQLREIGKFFHTYTEEVVWYYKCRYIVENGHDVEIKIFPCEPSPECTPVKVSERYTKHKWVCAQSGKEL